MKCNGISFSDRVSEANIGSFIFLNLKKCMEKKPQNKINQIKSQLYSRKSTKKKERRKSLLELDHKTDNSWGDLSANENENEKNIHLHRFKKKGPSVFSIMLILSLVFFVSAVSFTSFFLFFNQSVVKNNIEMHIVGPSSIKSGEVLNFSIVLENPTELDHRDIEFRIVFPESTIDKERKEFIKNKTYKASEPLRSGGKINQQFSAIFSGSVGDVKEIEITARYKIGNFSNILSLKKIHKVKIESSPVNLEIEYPKEVLSNKDFEIKVNILSNTNETLNNLIIIGRYPSGFKFESSEPEAVFSDISQNVFKINQLKPGERKNIIIRGKLLGQDTEKKFFSFNIGDSIPLRNEIRTVFSRAEKEITIKKPDIYMEVSTNKDRENGDAIVFSGDVLTVNWNLSNNLTSVISDIKVTASIPQGLFEKERLKVESGFYDSNKDLITWNRNTNPSMKSLLGNSSIADKFEMIILGKDKIAGYFKDPTIEIDFTVSGSNFDDQNSPGKILEEFSKKILIPTEVTLETFLSHKEGPFDNIGEKNPVVGEATTYTVVWRISNTSSDITDVEVRAKLPLYVEFMDKIKPSNAYISYDSETREVIWRHNKIKAFIGYRTHPRTVYFQVRFIPSSSQVSKRPMIIGEKVLRAKDTHTEREIVERSPAENTTLPDNGSRIFTLGTVQSE